LNNFEALNTDITITLNTITVTLDTITLDTDITVTLDTITLSISETEGGNFDTYPPPCRQVTNKR
jgi:uncharacterized protein YcgI (DUF1989 family)